MTPQALLGRAIGSAQVRLARNVKINACRNRLSEPVISFTFDDFPRSALTEGGRMVREAGWVATYFTAGSFCGRRFDGLDYFDRDDLLRAESEGHEIACHTFSHLRLRTAPPAAILQDLQRNADFLNNIFPGRAVSSFAYPYGDLNITTKRLIGAYFPNGRGIWHGLNAGRIDFAQLKAIPLERRYLDNLDIGFWLDRAVASNAWLIFFTHDVSEHPTDFGCRPDQLARIIREVSRRGIRVLPVKEAAMAASAGEEEEESSQPMFAK
jgi:peptidoglycan/xylan/chitin deacetylase (PgdA/CDA1 family)